MLTYFDQAFRIWRKNVQKYPNCRKRQKKSRKILNFEMHLREDAKNKFVHLMEGRAKKALSPWSLMVVGTFFLLFQVKKKVFLNERPFNTPPSKKHGYLKKKTFLRLS